MSKALVKLEVAKQDAMFGFEGFDKQLHDALASIASKPNLW